jgi:hypothetical protein
MGAELLESIPVFSMRPQAIQMSRCGDSFFFKRKRSETIKETGYRTQLKDFTAEEPTRGCQSPFVECLGDYSSIASDGGVAANAVYGQNRTLTPPKHLAVRGNFRNHWRGDGVGSSHRTITSSRGIVHEVSTRGLTWSCGVICPVSKTLQRGILNAGTVRQRMYQFSLADTLALSTRAPPPAIDLHSNPTSHLAELDRIPTYDAGSERFLG